MKTNIAIDASLAVFGFVPANTGGGCTAYWHQKSGDVRISITTDEATLPTEFNQPAIVTVEIWKGSECFHVMTLEFRSVRALLTHLKHVIY